MSSSIEEALDTIKKHSWIKNMGDRYLNKWIALANKYAPNLDAIPIKKDTGYTRHDFSYHCKDIYHIIENVFLANVRIEEEEYFVLAVAVLLHDISMTQIHFDRLSHSQQSVDYIEREIHKGEDIWNGLDVQTIGAIEQIVRAHSDIKEYDSERKEKVKNYTLRETEEKITGETCTLHVRWLAAVLRLADELDITVNRKGVADKRFEELSDEDKDERYSKQCWMQLNYFEAVRLNKATIEIVLYKKYLRTHLNDDKPNIVSDIKHVRDKVFQQVKETNTCAFDNDEDYMNKIKIRDVRIIDNEVGISESELEVNLGRENINEEKPGKPEDIENEEEGIGFNQDDDTGITEIVKEDKPNNRNIISSEEEKGEETVGDGVGFPLSLDKDLCREITEFIYSNDLIDYGHYRLNRRFCAEKWIDVRAVLSDAKMSKKISEIISRDLRAYLNKNSINVEDVLLVGVSMNGNILASRVAFRLGTAFTYVVPVKPGISGTDIEKKTIIDGSKKVILFTGAVSSYDTITHVIKEYFEQSAILRVYTVFWRDIGMDYQMPKELNGIKKMIERKIIYLDDDFPCEILGNEKCVNRKYGNCIARNKSAYEEIYDWPLAVKDNISSRIFINNIIGCAGGCQYCYLEDVGIQQIHTYSSEEVIAEFERLYDVTPQKMIISFGCYSECMMKDNLPEMERLIKYFAEKKYYIQISTKKKLDHNWLKGIEKNLVKKAQLNIYVSLPTLKRANELEPNADCIVDRIQNFSYQSSDGKIEMYMYIKPFLDDVTFEDVEEYIMLQDKYKIKTVVGNRFRFDLREGEYIKVGKNEMYEKNSFQITDFVNRLSKSNKIYYHSTDPIKEEMSYIG